MYSCLKAKRNALNLQPLISTRQWLQIKTSKLVFLFSAIIKIVGDILEHIVLCGRSNYDRNIIIWVLSRPGSHDDDYSSCRQVQKMINNKKCTECKDLIKTDPKDGCCHTGVCRRTGKIVLWELAGCHKEDECGHSISSGK